MSIAKASSSRPPPHETWLDHLPHEINVRIATFLTSHPTHINDDPLKVRIGRLYHAPLTKKHLSRAFAAVSPFLKRAYADSLTHAVTIPDREDPYYSDDHMFRDRENVGTMPVTISYFRELFHDHVHEVHLPQTTTTNPALEALLALPSIKRASIPAHPAFLIALFAGASVRDLLLFLKTEQQHSYVHHYQLNFPSQNEHRDPQSVHLSELLQDSPLEHLQLKCLHYGSRSICTINPYITSIQRNKPQNLKTLHIACGNIPRYQHVFSSIQNLDNLILERRGGFATERFEEVWSISEDVHHHLRTVPSLSIHNCGSISSLSSVLGPNHTALSSSVLISRSDIRALNRCSNLQHIDLILPRGIECFPESLIHLRSITLSWTKRSSYSPADYCTITPGALADLVSRNEQLKELRLNNVIISRPELQVMLSCIGAKLRVLEVPILYQGEFPVHRLSFLIRLIVVHNRNICDLYVPWSLRDLDPYCPRCHKEGTCGPSGCEYCKLRDFVDFVIPVLKRRLLYLCETTISRLRSLRAHL